VSPGKLRRLARCATPEGHFVILAIDHRANLREALDQHASAPLSDGQLGQFKRQVVEAADGLVTAVLIDPANALPTLLKGGPGVLMPLEVTDYNIHPSQRELSWIPDWSVVKIGRVGGDGAKLLFPYHPDLPQTQEKEAVLRVIIEHCRVNQVPLFLEPIACSLRPDEQLDGAEQRELTVYMAERFCKMGVDVLKLQLPGPAEEWDPTCRELKKVCTVPWTLLSGGVSYDDYCRQAEIACAHGASGVIVGRALWNESTRLQGHDRQRFLADEVPSRLRHLRNICRRATPWTSLTAPQSLTPEWFEAF
jgi:tagatose 1,6-diphosphate aldolase